MNKRVTKKEVQLGKLNTPHTEPSFSGGKDAFTAVGDYEVSPEVTSNPKKVRMPGPVPPGALTAMVEDSTLPDLVKKTIKSDRRQLFFPGTARIIVADHKSLPRTMA